MADVTAGSVFTLYALMFLFAAFAFAILWWAVRSGAVASSEAPKYRMMLDDGDLPPETGGSHGDAR